MDVKNLIRDGEKVISHLKEIGDQLITTNGCKIYFPKRFVEKNIATIGSTNEVIGFVGIVIEDKYFATLSVITMLPFEPDETNLVDIDGTIYYEMVFDPGSVVCPNLNCVRQDTLCFAVYDIFFKGCVPWYMDYEDMCKIYSTASEYANASIGDRPEAIALSVSLIARNAEERKNYYRYEITNPEYDKQPVWISMKSVDFSATSTINKLGGNYFQDGVVSSLVDPTEKVEKIEAILRQ
jgi:hypothetical protein